MFFTRQSDDEVLVLVLKFAIDGKGDIKISAKQAYYLRSANDVSALKQ